MVSRLPNPGQDSGQWGTILNDYLLQSHNNDGTLKPNSVTSDALAPGSVTKADVGLGNVNNTSDADKPISTAAQTALNSKADLSHSHGGGDITSGTIAPAILGDGTASSTTYLRGDGTWATPAAASSIDTEVYFSTLAGADDDAKLASFMTTQASQTLKGRTLVLDEVRTYTFTQPQTLYNGFSLRGPFRPQDQARASQPLGNRINLRMTGDPKGWFNLPSGNTFGVSITNLSIDGDANSRLVDGRSDGVLWTSAFRDISIQNALGVLGSPTQSLLVTASTIDGWWNVNNVRQRAFIVGGSDLFFQPSMMLLDSPAALLSTTEALMSYDFVSNSWLQNIYCTAEGHAAFLIGGSNTTSTSNWIKNSVWEGRNAASPSPGALMRINGGQYVIRDCRFAYAMTDPTSTGRNDAGVIHIQNGNIFVDGCTYNMANGVTADTPFMYVAGGTVKVRNIVAPGFTVGRKPRVYAVTTGLVDADDSVEVFIPTTPSALTGAGNVTTAATNTGTTITVTKPANLANQDLLVAMVFARNNTAPYSSVPAGFTEVAPSTDAAGPGLLRFYYKPITDAPNEPVNYTWSGGLSGRNNVIMFRVTNANLASPIGVKTDMTTAISTPYRLIIPSLTPTAPSSLMLLGGSATTTGGVGGAYYSHVSVTQVGTATTTTGTSESATTVGQKVVPAGATGTTSWVSSIDGLSTGNGYAITINGVF